MSNQYDFLFNYKIASWKCMFYWACLGSRLHKIRAIHTCDFFSVACLIVGIVWNYRAIFRKACPIKFGPQGHFRVNLWHIQKCLEGHWWLLDWDARSPREVSKCEFTRDVRYSPPRCIRVIYIDLHNIVKRTTLYGLLERIQFLTRRLCA